jgi:hypothetical protein
VSLGILLCLVTGEHNYTVEATVTTPAGRVLSLTDPNTYDPVHPVHGHFSYVEPLQSNVGPGVVCTFSGLTLDGIDTTRAPFVLWCSILLTDPEGDEQIAVSATTVIDGRKPDDSGAIPVGSMVEALREGDDLSYDVDTGEFHTKRGALFAIALSVYGDWAE